MEVQHRALIVDDNNDNREIFRIVLESVGYTAYEATNGVAAMSMLQKGNFELMLLDMQMPQMDGRAVLNEVRGDPLFDSMIIVVVTANPQIATIIEDLASYVLYKPIEPVVLATFLQRIKRTPSHVP